MRPLAYCCACLLMALGSGPVDAAEIMILGSFHFDNPGQDLVNVETDDVLAPKRQVEIQSVVDALARFRPTKIAVELTPENEAEFNKSYAAWRRAERELTRNERQQLGMRLAKALDHDKLYAIDVPVDMDFNGAFAAGAQAGQAELLKRLSAEMEAIRAIATRMQGPDVTIEESLRQHNGQLFDEGNWFYLLMTELGSGDSPAGAEMVAQWYRRNLLIFANILRLIESDEERVLVIYGSGHRAHLREFVDQHPDLSDVSPLDYLSGE